MAEGWQTRQDGWTIIIIRSGNTARLDKSPLLFRLLLRHYVNIPSLTRCHESVHYNRQQSGIRRVVYAFFV